MRFIRGAVCFVLAAPLLFAGVGRASAVVLPGSEGASAPVIAAAPDGTLYVGGVGGLWRVDSQGSATALHPGPSVVTAAVPQADIRGLAVDAAGYVHVAEVTANGSVSVLRSIDQGETWDRGTPLASAADGTHARPVGFAAGQFNSGVEGATLTLAASVGSAVLVSRSIDGGLSFPQRSIAGVGCCGIGGVVTDALGGDVGVVYNAGCRLAVAHSTDGGIIFSTSIAAEGCNLSANSIARTGNVWLVSWSDGASAHISRSTDGVSWEERFACSGSSPIALAVDAAGRVAALWSDGGRLRKAISADLGATFTCSTVAGTTSSGPDVAIVADPKGAFVAAYRGIDGIELTGFAG